MIYTCNYTSPLGEILLAADDNALLGLWFAGQKYFARGLDGDYRQADTPVLLEARHWLDAYFSGRRPALDLPLAPKGTEFQQEVWSILLYIPYGETTTYGSIASILAQRRGLQHFSAQAVGGAIGRNPISVIIPCHRVLGADGSLIGYAGGAERKAALLRLEQGQPL